jgi:hypothetical protein
MTKLSQWAQRHKIADHAVAELRGILGMQSDESGVKFGDFYSEAGVQSAVRLEAAQKNILLFRNNVGAFESENGRWVRYGLANDSPQMNSKIKSGDLIGVRPVLITEKHIGHTIGQFVSREIKAPGWKFTGTARELAQQRWVEVITGAGGDARFTNTTGTL